MKDSLSRSALLLGESGVDRLVAASVIVFGVGGVGGYAVEALARAGIGRIGVVDADVVSESNINRQILATSKTLGKSKVALAKERILEINPDCKVDAYQLFYSDESAEKINLSDYDYVIDAIDTVKSKLLLITKAKNARTPIISSLGTGNKLDPTAFKITDIKRTSVCPLARVMRTELKKLGIEELTVLYSDEPPIKACVSDGEPGRHAPGSVSFVPSVAGLIIAGHVIKELSRTNKSQ